MVEQNDLSELNKLKLNELIQKFEKCFTMKGYKPNSTFNSKVWFLKDDQSFQSLVQNKTPYSSTPKPNNKIIDLILDLNPGMDIKNLNVPVIALVDTNCDPTDITYPIPSNDDALRTISLFCNAVADAVCEGKKNFQAKFNRTENMQ